MAPLNEQFRNPANPETPGQEPRWTRLLEGFLDFLQALASHEDPVALLDAVHEFFVRSINLRSSVIILQTFSGNAFKIYHSHPELPDSSDREWKRTSPLFHWYRTAYVEHVFIEGPTQRAGERELALEARHIFAEFQPSLCFPLMAGTEQIGLLLLGDDLGSDPLATRARELLCLLVRHLNLALTRLCILEEIQTIGRLPRGLAHDLKTLLTPVRAFINLAGEPGVNPDALAELQPIAKSNLESLDGYIKQARSLTSGLAPAFVPLRLAHVVRKAAEIVQIQFKNRNVTLSMEQPADIVVPMDESLMTRLIVNLLTNALNASSPGRKVQLDVENIQHKDLGPAACIRITDEGPGISHDRLQKLNASPFGLRDDAGSGRGMGIGLSICRRIAQHHHAVLTLHCGEYGGTVAQLLLPQKEYR